MTHSLVTGAAGFIGSNLVRYLLAQGHEITALDNLSTGKTENLQKFMEEIRFINGDVRDQSLMKKICSGVDYVFHQAAVPSVGRSVLDPWESHDNNVNGTLSLLLAARDAGVRRVVYAASSSAYGDTLVLPKVEAMHSCPLSPYGVSKYVGELYCSVFSHLFDLETVSLRYFNVFGPQQDPNSEYSAVIPNFIHAMLRNEPPVIYGDGSQSRDFTYVDNVTAANLQASLAPKEKVTGKVFNIGCGQRASLLDIFYKLASLIGFDGSPVFAESRPGDVLHSQADIQRAQECLGYEPIVDVDKGLDLTWKWLNSQR